MSLMEPLAAFVASSATKVVLAALAVIASVVWSQRGRPQTVAAPQE